MPLPKHSWPNMWGCFEVMGQCPCVESICLGLGDLLSLEGLSE